MDEVMTTEVAVADKVRVHFHPPGPMKSFFEGVVRRVDVTTPNGCYFVVEVTHKIILDREHRVGPGFQDYVRYEDRNDFLGRIEVLSAIAQEADREPAPVQTAVQPLEEAEREAEQETHEPHSFELEVQSEPEIVPASEAEANVEPVQVDVEPQPARKPRRLVAVLFGQKR
jgi:hypothetical protein